MTTTSANVTSAGPPASGYGAPPDLPPRAADVPTRDFDLPSKYGERVAFRGQRLGVASSRRDEHVHPGVPHAPKGYQCSACRWFRVQVFLVDPDSDLTYYRYPDATAPPGETPDRVVTQVREAPGEGGPRRYLVQTAGLTAVPGESDRPTVYVLPTPVQVVRVLTVVSRGPAYLPDASVAALAAAADHDPWFDLVYGALIEPLDRRRRDAGDFDPVPSR